MAEVSKEQYHLESLSYRLERRPWWSPSWQRRNGADRQAARINRLVGITFGLLALVFFFVVGIMGMGLLFGAATLVGVVALVTWFKPLWALVTFTVLAPLHQFAMMLLLHFSGSGVALRIAQGWKEVILVVLLVKCVQLVLEGRRTPKVLVIDALILCYVLITLGYLAFPSEVAGSTLQSKLYGARTDAMFLLSFFLARGLRITREQVKTLVGITVAISIPIALIAFFQVAAPGLANELFDRIGYTDFVEIQSGIRDGAFAVRQREVPGLQLTRASSLLLGDLALAFYQLFMVPLALGLFLVLRGAGRRLWANLYVLMMLGTLAATVTRSAAGAAGAAVVVMLAWRRHVGLAGIIFVEMIVGLAIFSALIGLSPDRIEELFSLEESSSRGHFSALEGGLALVQEAPFGRGLGTSGTIAQRFTPIGGYTPESWYFQIANEMGVGQAFLFVAITVAFIVLSFHRYQTLHDPLLRALCLALGGGAIGYALTGVLLHSWEALTPSMLFWFFGGVVAAAPEIEAVPAIK